MVVGVGVGVVGGLSGGFLAGGGVSFRGWGDLEPGELNWEVVEEVEVEKGGILLTSGVFDAALGDLFLCAGEPGTGETGMVPEIGSRTPNI